MRTFYLIVISALLFCQANKAAAQQPKEKALQEIAAAENAFADDAAARGTRDAFLKYAADDAVVFNSQPVNAKSVWSKKEKKPFLLEWRPHWVDADASGSIGLSTGSWEFSPKAEDAPVAWGEFFTIWKRQPNGEWLWVLDAGLDHEKAPVPKNAWKSPVADGNKIKIGNSPDTWQSIEDDFARAANKMNAAKVFAAFASEQIRLLRHDDLPMQGKKAAVSFLEKSNANLKWKALNGELVSDFAYTYGEYESTDAAGKTETGHFVRVWKRERRGWRIIADFAKPISKQ